MAEPAPGVWRNWAGTATANPVRLVRPPDPDQLARRRQGRRARTARPFRARRQRALVHPVAAADGSRSTSPVDRHRRRRRGHRPGHRARPAPRCATLNAEPGRPRPRHGQPRRHRRADDRRRDVHRHPRHRRPLRRHRHPDRRAGTGARRRLAGVVLTDRTAGPVRGGQDRPRCARRAEHRDAALRAGLRAGGRRAARADRRAAGTVRRPGRRATTTSSSTGSPTAARHW